jgi:hypothetical protein
MIQIFDFLFHALVLLIIGSLLYCIFKGIFDFIKELFISLFIWMGDEELKKKREEKREREFLEYDNYQG